MEIQPALLAHHYTEAGRAEPAIAYWQQAGQRALERSAYVEALAHLTQGMALLTALPETTERMHRELTLLLALGPVFYAVKGWVSPELVRVYGRARALCGDVEDPRLFPVLYGLWQVHSNRGEQGTAQELAAEFLHLARRLHDPALEVVGCSMVGANLFRVGEFGAALQHLIHGARLYDPQRHQTLSALYMVDPGGTCHCFAAHVLWLLGYPDQALQQCQAALTLAKMYIGESLDKTDLHVHVPAGATPKDGPSAGVAMFLALASLLAGKPVRADVAMTGEISLRGLVLPIGGVKEKVLAALRAGIKTVMLPERNRRDLDEIPADAREQLQFVWVADVDQAVATALSPVPVAIHS